MNFIFWNVKGKQNNVDLILQHAKQNDVDVVAICEAPEDCACTSNTFIMVEHVDEITDIQVFKRGSIRLKYVRENSHFVLLKLEKNDQVYNIAVVHFPSLLHDEHEIRWRATFQQLNEGLSREEQKQKNKNTLILGDFNRNIFEDSLAAVVVGFNAKLFRFLTERPCQIIDGQQYDILYNPMLNLYKDIGASDKAYGTYFYRENPLCWLCFDNVLLKHPIIDKFDSTKLKILDTLVSISLVRNYKPDRKFSDHLPLYFEIDL